MERDVKTAVHRDDLRVDLRGKTAVVSGAATGIGSAIATRFGQSGANVVIDYVDERNRQLADDVVEAVRGRKGAGHVEVVRGDVTLEADAEHLISVCEGFGGIDVLINNAGIEMAHPVVDTPLDVWERILRVNLTGSFLCARAAARAMIRRKRAGRIINISSVHEELAMPNNAAYAASKGGVRMLMRTLALELAPHGITVNDVAPGAIATRINRDVRTDPEQRQALLAEIPLGRVGEPDEVAALCAYLASDAARYVTAATVFIDGGLSRFTKGL